MHPNDGQDVVCSFSLFGSLDAARPPVHIGTCKRLACDIYTENFASARLFNVLVVIGRIRNRIDVEAFYCDCCTPCCGFYVLWVEGTAYGLFAVVLRFLIEGSLQGFGEASFLDELETSVAFQDG